jgi:hypothetical protein
MTRSYDFHYLVTTVRLTISLTKQDACSHEVYFSELQMLLSIRHF